jgi:large subunit ribosomal protein L10
VATPEKEAAVTELKGNIESCTVAIMAQYKGITVDQVTDLRKKMRDQNVTFKVFKNTLAKRALDELELGDASQYMDGPTVWAFSDDPIAPAKILKDFGKGVQAISMVGGVLDGEVVNQDKLQALADLPSREQLLAQIAGLFASPMSNMAALFNALPQNMVGLIDALKEKKEQEGEAA